MMNQDDIILLGEFLEDIDFEPEWVSYDKYKNLVEKAKIVSKQAKASKEYQELMDELNTELSDIGKDDKDGKK